MKKIFLLKLVLIISLGSVQHSHANVNSAKESSNEQSIFALNKAIADVKRRLMLIKPNMRISYVRKKDNNDGTIRMYKFTPKGLSEGEWIPIHTDYTNNNTENKTWEDDALFSLDAFDLGNVELKSETENSWIFQLPSFVELNVDSEKTDQPLEHGEASKVIQAELEVTKLNSHFISYRIYSIERFKPQFMVKISKLNIYNTLSEPWTNGPLVVSSQTKDVEGSIGFLISIDDHITALYSDFKLVEID
jgi:hypothetical protein